MKLEENKEIPYTVSDYCVPEADFGINWSDLDLGVNWLGGLIW